MIVLDSSAVLALLRREPGAGLVAGERRTNDAVLGAANWAEIASTTVDAGGNRVEIRRIVLGLAGVLPVEVEDATLAGALQSEAWARPLSLGDRLCLALGVRVPDARVLTADRAWSECPLPVSIELIR